MLQPLQEKTRLTLEIGGRNYIHELIINEERELTSQLILGQDFMKRDEYDNLRPLTFFGRKLNKAEINYSTIGKRSTSICVWSENKQDSMSKISYNGSH